MNNSPIVGAWKHGGLVTPVGREGREREGGREGVGGVESAMSIEYPLGRWRPSFLLSSFLNSSYTRLIGERARYPTRRKMLSFLMSSAAQTPSFLTSSAAQPLPSFLPYELSRAPHSILPGTIFLQSNTLRPCSTGTIKLGVYVCSAHRLFFSYSSGVFAM